MLQPGTRLDPKSDSSVLEALLADSGDLEPQPEDQQFHCGKCVLITGAGGSIGSALARRIGSFHPRRLILLDTCEHGLHELDIHFTRVFPVLSRRLVVGSVGDRGLVDSLLRESAPDLIYHAAAHKHVPLMEENPFAAISNNSLGAWSLAAALANYGAGRLLMISTDKAADPVGIMGASKRIAEIAVQNQSRPTAPMSSIRLGNVPGTQGSVLGVFRAQLDQGGPLTVTHPDAERFFLRTGQALRMILEAMRESHGGEILAPGAADAVRIVDLANYLIARHQSHSGECFPIEITGLRPGEKLRETFFGSSESPGRPVGKSLRAIRSPVGSHSLDSTMTALRNAIDARDPDCLLRAVAQLVPEYQPGSRVTGTLRSPEGSTRG